MLGPILQLPAVHLQSLSELERFRLREISLYQLHERGLCSDITPDAPPGVFGVPLSDVIAQDRIERQRVFAVRDRRACTEVESSVLSFLVHTQRAPPRGSSLELPLSPTFRDGVTRIRRRGALSVDSITELDNGDARLLEALQLSHSNELQDRRKEHNQKLSLNPVYKQVPRIVERCCSHLENYGLHTVGIFRIGSSKKRVEQLREEFAVSGDVLLGEDTCVHDVSALLKAFLRDLPDPVLPRELYSAFIHTAGRGERERLNALQLLVFALPMCNADTLLRILQLLHNVALHEHDTTSSTGEQVPGNKMSVTNLATVFGPNLLQGVKSPESEIQSFQDSSAQIRVTETLIQHYQELYMVPSHIHGDILMSLLHSDPEVIDFLLRRKFSVAQILDGAAQSSLDVQQLKKDLRCSLLPHRPLQTLMEMLSIGVKSDFLDSRLSRRRPSRSQEDLTVCPSEPPTKTIFPSRPRFLPLFSKATASPQSHSLDTPSPVLSPSKLQMVTEEITKTFGFGKTAV
ncbi:hypothetical protein XENTR_v10020678 [Xenopus tropicalis]|uniref:Rho GTPase activating protein 36 n=1 Tax=Xenopus tropicalis TaxID=8364 RepID=A0A803JZF7_XENTR|nr:rho GTPase-activating protein 36 isoform X2 [Xenopus tropicalis]KAE8583767.1 hypothetical protein XENTR_v10020678 [Xenopus tropicalis]